jgi:hypothetical protein
MMLDFKLQKPYDAFLIRAHDKYGIPLILTNDCHYCQKDHSRYQQLMLMMQNNRTIQELEMLLASGADDIFELQDTNLWMKSESELNDKWESDYQTIIDYELYKQSKANTVKICEMAKGVSLDRSIKLPTVPDQVNVFKKAIMQGFEDRNVPKTQKYLDRLKMEYELISKKGFISYFLIEQMMVKEAMRICPELCGFDDVSVARGPGRGCLHPHTPIRSINGTTKPISEIHPGEMVLTKDGSFQIVEKVFKYPLANETVRRIRTYYDDDFGVSLTHDHEIYAVKDMDDVTIKPSWMAAGELEIEDWCFLPIPNVQESNINDISEYLYRQGDSCVPEPILNAPLHIVAAYLHGYFLSDGHEDEHKIKFETTSPVLAEQIRYLLLRLGLPSSLKIDDREDPRPDRSRSRSYIITCPLDVRIGTRRSFEKQDGWRRIENGLLLKIREIKEETVDFVYDLQVKNNHNYTTGSFLVHNSQCGSLIGYLLDLHDLDPIEYDLSFSRFLSWARGGKQMKIRFSQKPISTAS